MRQPVQELIERYQKNLYAAAFNICKNQMDAEDVVQETFVQYYTIKKEFENERHIRAWLLRVAINKAKNLSMTFWKSINVPWKIIWKHWSLQIHIPEICLKK